MPGTSQLPVTERTRHHRLHEQGSTDRRDLEDILGAGVICHLGVIVDGEIDHDIDWTEIAEICQDAYRVIAPARLVAQLDG
jgi:hypothetical protein